MTSLLRQAGIEVERARAALDLVDLMQEKAQLFFLDADFFENDPAEAIRMVRALVGDAVICIYAEVGSSAEQADLLAAGADCVIPKSADEKEFSSALQATLQQHH